MDLDGHFSLEWGTEKLFPKSTNKEKYYGHTYRKKDKVGYRDVGAPPKKHVMYCISQGYSPSAHLSYRKRTKK